MELPDVGQQCDATACKQLDFLPLKCKCGKLFCSEHFNLHAESCPKAPDRASVEARKIENTFKCSREGCNEASLVPLFCSKCRKHFCIQHRHLVQCETDENAAAAEKERYAAPVRQFNKAKSAVDQQIEHSLAEAKRRGKNSLANKVQLMKIKNKAKGLKTIPIADRVYFSISAGNDETCPVFVARTWSVGRTIDAVAAECNLRNDNNKSTEKKLRLFKKDNGEVISKNVSDVLQTLIDSGVIVDGENLVIDYVVE